MHSCANAVLIDTGTTVMMAAASANSTVILKNMVILLGPTGVTAAR
jgi:hypothetical protein